VISIGMLCSVLYLAAAPGTADVPETGGTVAIDEVIASLVRDLGSDRYDVREQASESLRHIGLPVLGALEKAAESEDPEVRLRAREVLYDVRLGISPDWPSEMVLLVRHYDRLGESERREALRRIVSVLAEKAVPFLLQRLADANPGEADYAINCLAGLSTDEAPRQVIALLKEPTNPYEAKALAWARMRTGSALEALRILTDAEIADNKVVEAGIQEVLGAIKARKYEETARLAHEFAEAAANEPRFLYLEAEACAALGRNEEAQALCEKALAMNPDAEAPHYAAGEMLGKLGRRRLAAQEWQAILNIPPADSVYDINAHLRLGSICAACGLYQRAVESMAKALELFTRAREAGEGMGMVGGDEAALRMEIQKLARKARQFPAPDDAEIEDELREDEISVHVSVLLKEGKLEDLRRALAAAHVTLSMEVQPYGLKIFDVAPVSLRYDPEKREILLLLHNTPCAKPVPFEAKADEIRVAIATLDCYYLFALNVATGEAKRIARFEKDYVVRVVPALKVAAYADVVATINGQRYAWEELLKGVKFDFLPKEFEIVVEGTTPSGVRRTSRFKTEVQEPPIPKMPTPDSAPRSWGLVWRYGGFSAAENGPLG